MLTHLAALHMFWYAHPAALKGHPKWPFEMATLNGHPKKYLS